MSHLYIAFSLGSSESPNKSSTLGSSELLQIYKKILAETVFVLCVSGGGGGGGERIHFQIPSLPKLTKSLVGSVLNPSIYENARLSNYTNRYLSCI